MQAVQHLAEAKVTVRPYEAVFEDVKAFASKTADQVCAIDWQLDQQRSGMRRMMLHHHCLCWHGVLSEAVARPISMQHGRGGMRA